MDGLCFIVHHFKNAIIFKCAWVLYLFIGFNRGFFLSHLLCLHRITLIFHTIAFFICILGILFVVVVCFCFCSITVSNRLSKIHCQIKCRWFRIEQWYQLLTFENDSGHTHTYSNLKCLFSSFIGIYMFTLAGKKN